MSDTVSVEFGEEGGWRIAELAVDPADGGTAAVLTVISPLGISTTPLVSGSLANTAWASEPYELTSAGEWLERWTVTGTGKSKKRAVLRVAPDPFVTPSGARIYATTADYAHHLRATTPAGARKALHVASKAVDEMLFTAIYDVDDDNMPTDADVIVAMRDATCEQAEFASTGGDRYLIGATRPAGFSLGKLSVSRPAASAGSGLGGVGRRGEWSPRAWATLAAAGLTNHEPWS